MLLSVVDVYFNKDTMIRLNYFRSVAKHAMKWWQNKEIAITVINNPQSVSLKKLPFMK
jgi:hypothetical protein